MLNRVLGIDPGMSGALAVYCPSASAESGMRWHVMDIECAGEKADRRVVAPLLRDFVTRFDPEVAFVERAFVMPKQNVAAQARYMRAVGAIEAIVACLNIPIHFVTPQTWKKFHGLHKADKEASRALALRLFPEAADLLRRKLDHQRAESMLLAAYGARTWKG